MTQTLLLFSARTVVFHHVNPTHPCPVRIHWILLVDSHHPDGWRRWKTVWWACSSTRWLKQHLGPGNELCTRNLTWQCKMIHVPMIPWKQRIYHYYSTYSMVKMMCHDFEKTLNFNSHSLQSVIFNHQLYQLYTSIYSYISYISSSTSIDSWVLPHFLLLGSRSQCTYTPSERSGADVTSRPSLSKALKNISDHMMVTTMMMNMKMMKMVIFSIWIVLNAVFHAFLDHQL